MVTPDTDRDRPLLEVERLSFAYGAREILRDVSFRLGRGRTIAITGPSGCGKTTLLQICSGLREPADGRITNLAKDPAVVFQTPSLLPWKTAGENMALGLKAAGVDRRARDRRVRAQALQMNLTEADLEKYPSELSGGMQCRLALGRALILQPQLLFLDEPFSSLDMGLKEEFYRLLHEAADTAIFLITHDMSEAVRLADDVLVMAPDPGRIRRRFSLEKPPSRRSIEWVAETTHALCQDPVVREVFGLRESEVRRT